MFWISSTPLLAALALLSTCISPASAFGLTIKGTNGRAITFGPNHQYQKGQLAAVQPNYMYEHGVTPTRDFTISLLGKERGICTIIHDDNYSDSHTFQINEYPKGELQIERCGCHKGWRLECHRLVWADKRNDKIKLNCVDSKVKPDRCSERSRKDSGLAGW